MSSAATGDYAALRMQSRPSRGYELSFGTTLGKVGRLGAENTYVSLVDRETLCIFIYRSMDSLMVDAGSIFDKWRSTMRRSFHGLVSDS